MGCQETLDDALELMRALSVDIGPRRPCSAAELEALELIVERLGRRGVEAQLHPFHGVASGGYAYGAIFGAALAGGLLQRRRPILGSAIAAKALAIALIESTRRWTPVSDRFARAMSANLLASIRAAGTEREHVVLVGHVDTTRSGLVFQPGWVEHLEALLAIPVVSTALVAAYPALRRTPFGSSARVVALGGLMVSLGLIAERELRGTDVPGANDNASGTAVATALFAEIAANPLPNTRVDLLICGCEESGPVGSLEYVRKLDRTATPRPTFINIDTVATPDANITYLLDDGYALPLPASKRLVELCEQVATRRPELGLRAAPGTPGLPTDATAPLAYGYEAITLLAQTDDNRVANYHLPTDTFENADLAVMGRTIDVVRDLVTLLDTEASERP